MSPELEHLISLQHVDSAIAAARARIAEHPHRVAAADARLDGARQAVDAVTQRLKDNQDARRDLEKNAAMYQGRLSKFKEQLAAVKTNREYQAMQHEIETAQTDLAAAEEKVLERMMEADGIAGELKVAEGELAVNQKDVEAEKKTLAAEMSETEEELSRTTARRDAILRDVPAATVDLFNQVARIRKGIALSAATRDGLCSVCHVRLRPPVFQKVRQNDTIVQCEVCHRILYYVPPPPPIEQAVVHNP